MRGVSSSHTLRARPVGIGGIAGMAATPIDPTFGAPCTSDDQCHVGKCLTEAMNPRFVGGICTFFDVRGPEDCPPGTAYAGGTSTPACLL